MQATPTVACRVCQEPSVGPLLRVDSTGTADVDRAGVAFGSWVPTVSDASAMGDVAPGRKDFIKVSGRAVNVPSRRPRPGRSPPYVS